MDFIYDYLTKLGYTIPSKTYYENVEQWISLWKGKADWLDIRTVDGKKYPMYSLGMAKRSSEDLASVVTSEPFEIKAKANDKILQNDIKKAKILNKLAKGIETMAYSGTLGTVVRIKNAIEIGEDEDKTLAKGKNTVIKTIDVKGNQIIPLTIEDEEIINCAFVSNDIIKIDGKNKKVIYLEIHELKEKGYQITNKYFDEESGEEIRVEGIIETYNTLSKVPLFSILKLPKVNPIDNNCGLGASIYAEAIDQLKIIDLTYNNFGMDFKLGQKIMLVNKKLTKIVTQPQKQSDGTIKEVQKVIYPTDIQKQLYTDISNGITGNPNETPYIYEYNPDLRVGDNIDGIQFALNTLSFKLGYGVHHYSFEKGNITTATETILSRKDFVDNMIKVRREVEEYLKNVCKSLLLGEKILGTAVDENQEIEIKEVDGFLQDDESEREKMFTDLGAGLISKKRYLMKVYNLNEKDALKELQEIKNEEDNIEVTEEEEGE